MLKKLLHDRGIRWHRASDPSDHRLWVDWGRLDLHWEWYFLGSAKSCAATIDLNWSDTADVLLHLAIPRLFNIYFGIKHPWFENRLPGEWKESTVQPGRIFKMPTNRQIGIRVFDGAIWFSLWENGNEWSRDDPRWWQFNFRPIDALLGRRKRIEVQHLSDREFSVRLPEGIYNGTAKLERWVYGRKRWPFREYIKRCELEMYEPIPVPGKGENAWDMDDDAIHSMGCAAKSVDDAIIKLMNSVTRDRVHYGGPSWVPEQHT